MPKFCLHPRPYGQSLARLGGVFAHLATPQDGDLCVCVNVCGGGGGGDCGWAVRLVCGAMVPCAALSFSIAHPDLVTWAILRSLACCIWTRERNFSVCDHAIVSVFACAIIPHSTCYLALSGAFRRKRSSLWCIPVPSL